MGKKKSGDKISKILQRTSGPPTGPLLSSGSCLLNLACSGRISGAFAPGHLYHLVGDSSSGKTFLAMTCFAEAKRNAAFRGYRLIFDDVENGALMDLEKFFGREVAEDVEPPGTDADGNPEFSTTIEELYYNLSDAISAKRPFIYVIDSMDGLSSDAEIKKSEKVQKEAESGQESTGSYGDGKAKVNSANLRRVVAGIRKSGSIIILINQSRDNIGRNAMFVPKTHSGGRAIKFYSTLQMWSAIVSAETKLINGKKRKIGVSVRVKVTKNRIQGKEREVTLPIYYSYGFDDIGACIEYLLEEGHWSKNKAGIIEAEDLDFSGKLPQLIAKIEQENLESELHSIVAETWNRIEQQSELKRKKRYE